MSTPAVRVSGVAQPPRGGTVDCAPPQPPWGEASTNANNPSFHLPRSARRMERTETIRPAHLAEDGSRADVVAGVRNEPSTARSAADGRGDSPQTSGELARSFAGCLFVGKAAA